MDYRVKGLARGAVSLLFVPWRCEVWNDVLMRRLERGVVRVVDRPRRGCRMLGSLSCRIILGGVAMYR